MPAPPVHAATYSSASARRLNLYTDAGVILEEAEFKTAAYTYKDKIKVDIYDDLYIDFAAIYRQ